MHDTMTPGARRVMDQARQRAIRRGAAALEPRDLLAALADESESHAAKLLREFGLDSEAILRALGESPNPHPDEPGADDSPAAASEAPSPPFPASASLRLVLRDATKKARAFDRGAETGTEHLLAGLVLGGGLDDMALAALDLDFEPLRAHLVETFEAPLPPIPVLEEMPPLDLNDPVRSVDIGRILDASANRASEGLRVGEDYIRFVLEDQALTRRIKEVRHRLADALRGFDPDLLLSARDTRGDVGTHIMTTSEQTRENPRAVLMANFKRTAEALRTLEEYGKLVDVWLAGRFEVLRYDLYTLEKLTLTAVNAYRSLADAKLMVLVGGLKTMGDLTWVVGEALAGGADVIQLREKNLPDRELLSRAREIRLMTVQAKARFILNDRPDLARLASADGVHLGQDDLAVRDARRIVGPHLAIGVSTHDRRQLDAALLAGAGYLGVGPVFPSATKEFAEPELAGLSFVEAAAETTTLPWFAIGGITEKNVDRVIAAGATRIAVSHAVVKADRPRQAAANLKAKLQGRVPVEIPHPRDRDDLG